MKNNKTNKNSSSSSSSSYYYSYSLSFSFSSTSSGSLSPTFTLLGRSHIFLSYHHPLQHMQHIRFPVMELKEAYDIEHMRSTQSIDHELWPLDEIDPKKAKFPCCLVWTPLPIVSWLAPFIGHVGICREDGAILDFSGSNFVNADDFAFGAVARYLQLDRTQCCFATNLGGHTCKSGYKHAEFGTAITWDDALRSSSRPSTAQGAMG